MPRKLRIVKLTPIAISVCESCGREFHSRLSLEDDAQKEMEDRYAAHLCEVEDVVKLNRTVPSIDE
jgi:hypothetical protein